MDGAAHARMSAVPEGLVEPSDAKPGFLDAPHVHAAGASEVQRHCGSKCAGDAEDRAATRAPRMLRAVGFATVAGRLPVDHWTATADATTTWSARLLDT